jgi:hypothetical protein
LKPITFITTAVVVVLSAALVYSQQATLSPSPILNMAPSVQDSLDLQILDVEIARARVAVTQTDIWHRLLPQVAVSASVATKDLLFVDQANARSAVLPRDAFRVTASMSLSDILDQSRHLDAEYQLARLQLLRSRLLNHQELNRQIVTKRLWGATNELGLAVELCRIAEQTLRFKQLLFEQGRLQFDALMRARRDLIDATHAITRAALRQSEIQLQSGSDVMEDRPMSLGIDEETNLSSER